MVPHACDAERRPLCRVCVFARTKILEMDANIYVVRVASKENIADDPSRERYNLLNLMEAGLTCSRRLFPPLCSPWLGQAEAVEAQLEARFHDAQAWKSLGVTAHKAWRPQRITKRAVVVEID